MYTFKIARNKSLIPAIIGADGTERPLHSLFDPNKEADRLLDTVHNEGFLIFLGLGGGFLPAKALSRNARAVLVIDFDKRGIDELSENIDYSFLKDERAVLLIDPSPTEVEACILERYQPVLMDGMRVFPLRPRVDADPAPFKAAEAAILHAIETVKADYSTQARFGLRWFSNIVKNIVFMFENASYGEEGKAKGSVLIDALTKNRKEFSLRKALITAAGPSLDRKIPHLKERRREEKDLLLIATDTSFPALLAAGVDPDCVISIDCQLWSCQHFFRRTDMPLFLDMASPPLLAERSAHPIFFAGGHPLCRYFVRETAQFTSDGAAGWLPELDTSGGNVSYAAVSLAQWLGAESICLYGADFSYPGGISYARGTWLYRLYDTRQNRFSPAETAFSDLLYRTLLEKKRVPDGSWAYETPVLTMYRETLETRLKPPLALKNAFFANMRQTNGKAAAFLTGYLNNLRALSFHTGNTFIHNPAAATLFPTAAALKLRRPELRGEELMEAARDWCIKQLESVLRKA